VITSARRLRRVALALVLASSAITVASSTDTASASRSDVVIVGDSIVGGNQDPIRQILRERGRDVTIDARSGRTLTRSFRLGGTTVDSGVSAVRSLVASGRRPALWIIQLGTNDHVGVGNCDCPDPVAAAGLRIDMLLAELPADANVAWVTVLDTDFPESVRWFNTALAVRGLPQIPWFDTARDQRSWFLDDVHPSMDGVFALIDVLDAGIDAYLDGAPARTRSARRLGVTAYTI